MSKILFIQFSNSGAYPPIQNAVTLCLRDGHDVSVLCTQSDGAATLRFPQAIEKITRRLSRPANRFGLLFLFLRFTALVLWRSLFNRKQWVYASDPMAAPAAYYANKLFGCRVIYHEHDAPPVPHNRFQRYVNHARLTLAKTAAAIVIPNEGRLRLFLQAAECTDRSNVFTVWNCPLSEEVIIEKTLPKKTSSDELRLYFHGSISPGLLPLSLLQAMKLAGDDISLAIAGYTTDGGNHLNEIMQTAKHLNMPDRITYLGSFSRQDLLPVCAQYDVGICFYEANPANVNHSHMAGASNKPFDYMSQGLLLLVSESQGQRAFFDGLNNVLFCDVESVGSIEKMLLEIRRNTSLKTIARSLGPQIIAQRWNYAVQFKPVLLLLER